MFGISKKHVANRESVECPLLDNLCNINTRDIYFFLNLHLLAIINTDIDGFLNIC